MGIVGTCLDNTYTILEEIGHGGGGIVYKAYHERLKTRVVVKKVRDKVKGILESRAEADILKDMKHTYLPRVYDFLEIDGEVYTVMDYIPGENLKVLLEREHLFPQKQVLQWAIQLAQALEYLHGRVPPVIHSDIKPSNIMLTPEGNICLIDFNISLAFDREMKTSTGTSAGYSPPEQYRSKSRYYSSVDDTVTMSRSGGSGTELMGRGTDADETASLPGTDGRGISGSTRARIEDNSETAGTQAATQAVVEQLIGGGVDERSDIYSLGATLYHLLTGQKPSADFEAIRPVEDCGVDISEGFAHIIRKMTELYPDRRYQNGGELLYALQNIHTLDSEYIGFQRKWKRKRRLAGMTYGAAFLLLMAGSVISVREGNRSYIQSVEQAGSLIKEGNYELARSMLEEASQLRPVRIEAYRGRMLCLYEAGEYEECILYGREILNAPEYKVDTQEELQTQADICYILGNACFEQEDYENAVLCFENAVGYCNTQPQYYRDMASALARMGKTEEAGSALEKAKALGLSRDSLNMAEGEILFASGDYEAAMDRLSKAALQARDDDIKKRAALVFAKACRIRGDSAIEEEISTLEKVRGSFGAAAPLSITECIADAWARKAALKQPLYEQDYRRALQEFRLLYDAGYHTLQTLENIAVIYQQLGELDEADETISLMTQQYPESYVCYKRLAFLEADRQQTLPMEERDYKPTEEAWEKAEELYEKQSAQDTEMQMLKQLIRDLEDNGWL
ncbi:protein kinase domain-containing protein [Eisenbergiella porci]|uniref:protein kinase domain-containing protein n=1 Tax=Eisenbergiella porci TaxID=2652274 RepID=UPI002A7EC6A0|nr:protein kinase [Eisenbergiella porci]